MKTKKEATLVAKIWNEKCGNWTADTFTVAKVKKLMSYWTVEIYPAEENDGRAFYQTSELVGIAKAFRASCYVNVNKDGHAIGNIF